MHTPKFALAAPLLLPALALAAPVTIDGVTFDDASGPTTASLTIVEGDTNYSGITFGTTFGQSQGVPGSRTIGRIFDGSGSGARSLDIAGQDAGNTRRGQLDLGGFASPLVNQLGADLVVYENYSTPEPFAVAISSDGGATYSDFRTALPVNPVLGDPTNMVFATVFDFSSFGSYATVDAVRIINLQSDDAVAPTGEIEFNVGLNASAGFIPLSLLPGGDDEGSYDPDFTFVAQIIPAAVPEPASIGAAATLAGLLLRRRTR